MIQAQEQALIEQDKKSLMIEIISQFSGNGQIEPDQRLENIGEKKALLDYIQAQNPQPCVILEAKLALGYQIESKSFTGKALVVDTVADVLKSIKGIIYLY